MNKPIEPRPEDLVLRIGDRFFDWMEKIPWLDAARDLYVTELAQEVGCDFAAEVNTPGSHKVIVLIQAKTMMLPSDVGPLVSRLRSRTKEASFWKALSHAGVGDHPTPYLILAAPWLSPRTTRKISMEQNVGWFDLAGNAHLDFPGAYLHVEGIPNPFQSKERTIAWSSRHAQAVLSELLEPRNIGRSWKQRDLAAECVPKVSLGTVNKVAKKLVSSAYVTETIQGLRLSDPEGLLRDWAKSYEPIYQASRSYYTTLHGDELQKQLRELFNSHQSSSPDTTTTIALAGNSSASWFAPFLRTSSLCCYATPRGERALQKALQLQPADKGTNATVWLTSQPDAFRHPVRLPNGLTTTSLVQTYLDLWVGGERGQEAAEHLLTQKLKPIWDEWRSNNP